MWVAASHGFSVCCTFSRANGFELNTKKINRIYSRVWFHPKVMLIFLALNFYWKVKSTKQNTCLDSNWVLLTIIKEKIWHNMENHHKKNDRIKLSLFQKKRADKNDNEKFISCMFRSFFPDNVGKRERGFRNKYEKQISKSNIIEK